MIRLIKGYYKKKNKQLIKQNIKKKIKNGQKALRDIFPKKTNRWPTGTLNIINHWRNAN